jgi:Tfp pilus assembly protein PilP
MPRQKRIAKENVVYHVLNRANGRLRIFKKPDDFESQPHQTQHVRNPASLAADLKQHDRLGCVQQTSRERHPDTCEPYNIELSKNRNSDNKQRS